MIADFWDNERVPRQVKDTVLRPFLKAEDRDPTSPDNYRPIALMSTVRKIYEQILKIRIQNALENIRFFSKTQAAYRRGQTTCDHLLVLQEVFFHYQYSLSRGRKTPIFLCFLDLKKAFDTVPRKLILQN